MIRLLAFVAVWFGTLPVWGLTWKPTLDQAASFHAERMDVTVTFKGPVPERVQIGAGSIGDLENGTIPANSRIAQVATYGRNPLKVVLSTSDFKPSDPKKYTGVFRMYYTTQVDVTLDGKKDDGITGVNVRWINDEKLVFPWEKDPAPVGKDGALTWWPGAYRGNAGHFGWRIEPNGLLINNVSFNCIERSWYYFKPGRKENESFQFNFRIPDGLAPVPKVVTRGDEEKKTGEIINRAGIGTQYEYEVDKGLYAQDKIEADWTTFRWQRNVKTKAGKTYRQELRYSLLAVGVQVETDSPAFLLSFQDAKMEKGPAGIVIPTSAGVRVVREGEAVIPASMAKNWLVLLSKDGSPEVPVMIVFERRPEKLEWTKAGLIVHRSAGVGTLAIGTPFGATVQDVDLLDQWQKSPSKVPAELLGRFAGLLTGYPWKCKEEFAVSDGWVHIRDTVEFLPWKDDWNTVPAGYTPLPPLVAYAASKGYIPHDCVRDTTDLKIVTKWGPYWARKGNTVEYRLPIPDNWDYYPLQVEQTPSNKWLYPIVKNTLSHDEIQKRFGESGPGLYPHCAAHDFSCGAWRASNYLSDADRDLLRQRTRQSVLGALYPQNYRYRKDPVTGAQYVACTSWGAGGSEYDVNGDGIADIDYWQGLVIYGIYTHAKYAGMWDTMGKHWPTIRSMYSYWEALHSWSMMSPGAREAGELFHGDMPTAGYTGLVGFHRLADRLGTAYQKDLGAYLLAKASVPMITKFGFREWGLKLSHQELRGDGRCSGFGERFQASYNSVSNAFRRYEPGDPWWRTGCIGPQSGQPETMDLFVKGCYKDLVDWEEHFRKACPDKGFKTHDDIRVMPHVMLRTYLGGQLRSSGEYLIKASPRTGYLLRDAHVLAGLLSWDCPVRLVDWSPGYIRGATWTEGAGAKIRLDGPAGVQLAVHPKLKTPQFLLDGKAIEAKVMKSWKSWTLYGLDVPAGAHEITVGNTTRK